MTRRRPKLKGLASLAMALILLGICFFIWWRLAYVHNLWGDSAALVWKRDHFGAVVVDAWSPGGKLAYNLGKVPRSRRLVSVPFNDGDLFLLLYIIAVAWGLVQLYLAFYFLRQRAP